MDNNEKDMKDVIEEVALPEAPLSIHIDAYYQGFHTGITIRKADNEILPISKIKTAIDELARQGFKPSWNSETNKNHTGVGQGIVHPTPQKLVTSNPMPSQTHSMYCPIHDVQMTQKQGKFGLFYSHIIGQDPTGKNLYCNGK